MRDLRSLKCHRSLSQEGLLKKIKQDTRTSASSGTMLCTCKEKPWLPKSENQKIKTNCQRDILTPNTRMKQQKSSKSQKSRTNKPQRIIDASTHRIPTPFPATSPYSPHRHPQWTPTDQTSPSSPPVHASKATLSSSDRSHLSRSTFRRKNTWAAGRVRAPCGHEARTCRLGAL